MCRSPIFADALPNCGMWFSVEYEGVCETECLALLRRAKQQSDSQEAVLRARLSNEEVEDGRPTFEYNGV